MTALNTEVIMPQMGESITEAMITAWRCRVGDKVAEGDILLDISTAKVEVEIPSPVGGVIAEIRFPEGSTVPIDTVIAVLAPYGSPAAVAEQRKPPASIATPAAIAAEKPAPTQTVVASTPKPTASNGVAKATDPAEVEKDRVTLVRRRSTPLVRTIASELGIDLALVEGSGIHGRVTKKDLEQYIQDQKELEDASAEVQSFLPGTRRPRKPAIDAGKLLKFDTVAGLRATPLLLPPQEITISPMRRQIADQMVRSAQQIPQAYTVHEVDFTQLEKIRLRYKPVFEAQFEARLTPLVFVVSAVAEALLKCRSINATWAGDKVLAHQNVNVGIAVAVREGLVVPVIRNVETMSLAGIARAIVDVSSRARANKLKPSDMEGGTFTITSTGQLGAVMAIPLVNPPQGAILHFGAIAKTPVVVTGIDGEDTIAIRQRAMITLGIDHRLVDGWEADKFMIMVKERIHRADFGLPS